MAGAATGVKQVKRQLRSRIRTALRELSAETLKKQSQNTASALFETKAYKNSKALCVFLSMPTGEIDTSPIIAQIFKDGKKCFVPRCLSKTEMVMLEAKSLDDIKSFPLSKWKIPEPPKDENRANALNCEELDLIIVPGLAFDKQNRRCGQGAGFYDRFFSKIKEERLKKGLSMPWLAGIGLPCQLVEEVPTDKYDYQLNEIILG